MIKPPRPRSQGWKTFLRNHAAGIAAIDLFVVRTIFGQAALWSGDSTARSKAAGRDRDDQQPNGSRSSDGSISME